MGADPAEAAHPVLTARAEAFTASEAFGPIRAMADTTMSGCGTLT